MHIADEYLGNANAHDRVAHVFGWLTREGLVRCLRERKTSCVEAEVTIKGRELLNENRDALVKAVSSGAIEMAVSLISKVLAG
jgi:hypothetical protein